MRRIMNDLTLMMYDFLQVGPIATYGIERHPICYICSSLLKTFNKHRKGFQGINARQLVVKVNSELAAYQACPVQAVLLI